MKQKRDQRTILIVSLLVISLIMVAGFAAFATNLTINGTANISSNWCVGFDNTKTDTYEITKGKSTGTSPSATMGYDGTTCSTNYVPIANLGAVFYQPGDKVEYTLTIANKGSVDAAIESIEVNGSSVTSNQTITDGNIIWKVYMPESTTLEASTGTTTMKVSAEFQNTTDISNLTTGGSSSLTVGINVVQGTSGMAITEPAFSGTGTIYRITSNEVQLGAPLEGGTAHQYCDSNNYYRCAFNSLEKCQEKYDNCTERDIQSEGVGQFETDPYTFINNNQYVFLKHEVENGIVKTQETCYYTNNTIYCLPDFDIHNSYDDIIKSFNNGSLNYSNSHNCSEGYGNVSCWDDRVSAEQVGSGQYDAIDKSTSIRCINHINGYSKCINE